MQFLFILIFLIVFALYASLIIYYRLSWKSMPQFTTPSDYNGQTTVSVIIAARDESKNIGDCLSSISRQRYPAHLFEVVVVDDHSTDNTATLVRSFAGNIRLVSLKENVLDSTINSYKKKAIETGIKLSTGKLVVTTDADCVVPQNWLSTLVAFYEKYNPAFIAAPVEINYDLNFIQIFQAIDFMTLQGITGASVYKKLHSMCNGANLAYERSAFNKAGGFKGIDALASGDDMLLMHKIFQLYPDRIAFIKSKDVIVQTKPVNSVKAFFNQRIRWASKADKYDDKRIIYVLLLVYLFNFLLFIMPLIGLFRNISLQFFSLRFSLWQFWLTIFIAKILVELYFLFPVAGFFNKRSLLWLFPLLQPFHIVYTIVAGWLGKFGKYEWKGRQVK